jgi:hypothetical protein
MIRTRDLVIFLAILMFVLVGITLTLFVDAQGERMTLPSFFGMEHSEVTYSAEKTNNPTLDRTSIIDRLRSAIAQGEPEVAPSPSVEESEGSVSDTDVVELTPEVDYCANYDDSQGVVAAWPTGATFKEEVGLRKVVVSMAPAISASSSATSTSKERLLLVMPQSPVPSGTSCVPGEVIGVSMAGRVLLNSQVSLYRGYGAEYLIGYARDGFPIYGYYEGPTDSCGGYQHPSGYRYTITPDRDQVLSCFKSAPAAFIGF